MKEKQEERSRLALACYERAAVLMAQRAGMSFASAPDDFAALVTEAQRLALPQQPQAEKVLPALTSLVGHLYDHQAQGYYRPLPLAADAHTVMPQRERPADLLADYQRIGKDFAAARHQLFANAPAAVVQEVGYHALLQRFAWSMPAPGVGDSDVSLFDFARVSAALAVCLADGRQDEQIALLIGGDVSGVQDWLYTIGSSGAAKSLRGRSVYLQLLSEVIALYVLDELGLPSCNLLYVGGGNFYVVAPVSAAGALPGMQREISRRLLAMHGGSLYLALGHAPVTEADLLRQQAGAVWGRVNQVMGAHKRQRFSELNDEQMAQAIGQPLAGTGKLEDTCAICRRPIAAGERARSAEAGAGAESARNCELCESFGALGKDLSTAAFLVVEQSGGQSYTGQRINNWRDGLAAFGCRMQFFDEAQSSTKSWRADEGSRLARIYYWREADLTQFPGHPDLRSSLWIYRPLAQAAPVRYGEEGQPVATFDQLKTEGIERWGVLRMDVDNLGRIFQEGLPSASLSRVVGLSAQLRLLFESHVPLLLEQYNQDHPESTYLMYAGGDDLFVVAGWSHLPELAARIRGALVQFAMNNPRVTISGGISLALDENYPLYQAARAAGRAEDMAKDAGKNSLALLGQAVPWESGDRCNYAKVSERVQQLKHWLDGTGGEGRLNRSFLMRLRAIDAEWRSWRQEERRRELEQEREQKRQAELAKQQVNGPAGEQVAESGRRKYPAPRYVHSNSLTGARLYLGPWQWHLVYSLHRAVEQKRSGSLKNDIDQFVKAIVAGEIDVLGMEARWAELLTRASQSKSAENSTSEAKEVA